MTYLSQCAIKAATSESAFSLLLQHKATIVNGVLLAIGSTVATYISLFYYGTGGEVSGNASTLFSCSDVTGGG